MVEYVRNCYFDVLDCFLPDVGDFMVRLTTFGQWLRLRRKASDLTQAELAKQVHCSVSEIRKIEASERRPSPQIARLLAEKLEISSLDRNAFIKTARGERSIDWLIDSRPQNNRTAVPRQNPTISNLPVPPNPLIDRKEELEKINRLIETSQCRLLSLIGRGGIGKTRLAIDVATNQRDYFPDGVFFIPLSSISSADEIYLAIAESIDLSLFGSDKPGKQILDYLAEREMLLVLDNFEHLVCGANIISDIIQYAPSVKILVTSLERLNLEGEWVFELHGLSIPPVGQLSGLESFSSVHFFIQNATRIHIDFKPKAEDLLAIANICRVVDGLPLGIELAAGWVRTLSCTEIAREIETTMDIQSLAGRAAPERHLSLRAILDYTWGLLSDEEQDKLSKLSIFRDGFRRETAEQIAGASLQVLAALADKSLLYRNENGYYRVYELVRRYALSHLKPNHLDHIREKLKGTDFNALIAETTTIDLSGLNY
jgi:predicted ATPase/DNA-binding XRE family transcriptional regulator